jgi:hypothetical protein
MRQIAPTRGTGIGKHGSRRAPMTHKTPPEPILMFQRMNGPSRDDLKWCTRARIAQGHAPRAARGERPWSRAADGLGDIGSPSVEAAVKRK